MKTAKTYLLLVVAGVFPIFCSPAFAKDAVTVPEVTIQKVIPYAERIGNQAIRTQCDWNTKLSANIAAFAKGRVRVANGDLGAIAGRTLAIVITDVHSAGGGGYSGPKWANAHGILRDGEQVIGTFDIRRTTTSGGLTACGALDRVGKALGKDIAAWLKKPTLDARLGDPG